jgi:SAM-dependent methyltransferase
LADFLIKSKVVSCGDKILDVGCGNGRFAMGLWQTLERFSYTGVDVIKGCVSFCQQAFIGDERFSFKHLDLNSIHYNPAGTRPQSSVAYSVSGANLVTAWSLFSHTGTTENAINTIVAMKKCLDSGGKLFATWSLSSVRGAVTDSQAHTIYRLDDVINLYDELFPDYRLIPLGNISQNQIGILATLS